MRTSETVHRAGQWVTPHRSETCSARRRHDVEVGLERQLRDDVLDLRLRRIALLFEVLLRLPRRLQLVLGLVQLVDKALGRVVALQSGQVFAGPSLVVGQRGLLFRVLLDLAIDSA